MGDGQSEKVVDEINQETCNRLKAPLSSIPTTDSVQKNIPPTQTKLPDPVSTDVQLIPTTDSVVHEKLPDVSGIRLVLRSELEAIGKIGESGRDIRDR
ncbi:SAM domain-containing protein [Psidium guajava]|nr:SAM domain-containing protein [Psidium guajava]